MGCVLNKNPASSTSASESDYSATSFLRTKVSKHIPRMYKYRTRCNLITIKEVSECYEKSPILDRRLHIHQTFKVNFTNTQQ